MKLHVNTGYAIQILQYLHMHSGVPQSVISLSEFICVAETTVVRIVSKLKDGGLLKSSKGRHGGYCLSKSAYEISLYDVFVCMGSELQMRSRRGDVCDVQQNWIEYISGVPIAVLESNSFEGGMRQGLHHSIKSQKSRTDRLYHVNTIDNEDRYVPYDEIILIRSSPQNGILELHREHDLFEFYGRIGRVATGISEFFRSHLSVVVNINCINGVDMERNEIELSNGQVVPVAKEKVVALLHLMAAHN